MKIDVKKIEVKPTIESVTITLTGDEARLLRTFIGKISGWVGDVPTINISKSTILDPKDDPRVRDAGELREALIGPLYRLLVNEGV